MIIRDFVKDDLDEYLSMSVDFFSMGATLYPPDANRFTETFNLCLRDKTYARGLMIEENGEILGFCLLALTYSNECGGMVLWVEELYVKPEHRCKKIGTEVFAFLKKEYPHFKRFRLEVCHSNEGAIKLYENLGFKFLDYGQMIWEG